MNYRQWFRLVIIAFSMGVAHANAFDVVQILPMSGPLSNVGKEIASISQAVIQQHNQQAEGQRIKINVLDDGNVASRSTELAQQSKAQALLSCFGTVSCLAQQKVANATKTPLIGPIAGAAILRGSESGMSFAVRAASSDEIANILKYAQAMGIAKLAVLVQDDGFGRAYDEDLTRLSSKLTNVQINKVMLNPQQPQYVKAMNELQKSQSSALVLLANAAHSTAFLNEWRSVTGLPFVFNLAGQANALYANKLKGYVGATAFVTVVPSPWEKKYPIQIEYQKTAQAAGLALSYLGFEAYINARVLSEALIRSSAKNSADLSRYLNEMSQLDLNGFIVKYKRERVGSTFTDFAVLRADGTFKH